MRSPRLQSASQRILAGRTTREFKYGFYDRVHQRVVQRCCAPAHQACLYWSFHTLVELRRYSVHGALQAGTAYWPRVSAEDFEAHPDDLFTHFGFQWSPQSVASAASVAMGNLPEMHIWVGLVETQEILDLSTGHLPEACRIILDKDWPGPKPPKFYWGRACEVPAMVSYQPNEEATIYAGRLIQKLASERKL